MKPIKTESTNLWLSPPPGHERRVFWLPCTQKLMTVESCWQLTWPERLRVVWHGQIWFSCWGETHPPIKLEVRDDSGKKND